MWASLVDTCYQQSHTIRSFAVVLGIGLCAVADGGDEAFKRDGAAVGEAGGKGLLFHEVGEDAGVGGEASEGEAKVFVNDDDFLLVGGKLFCVTLARERWLALNIGRIEGE